MTMAVDFIVTGRVQGVFFRGFTEREAQRCGVAGWVRNEPDGSVSGHLEGDRAAIELVLAKLEEGPPSARVQQVSRQPGAVEGLTSFRVRY